METEMYNNFTELYAEYKDMIDVEFKIRHHFRLTQLKDSLENRLKWEHSYIGMFNNPIENSVARSAINVLDDIYSAVMKEIEMPIPMDLSVDEEIQNYKNKIIEVLYADANEQRGTKNYEKKLKRAGIIADLFESGIRCAYYDSHIDEIRKTNEVMDKLFDKQSKIRKQYLRNYSENTYGEFSQVMDLLTCCPDDKLEKKIHAIKAAKILSRIFENMSSEQIANFYKENEK